MSARQAFVPRPPSRLPESEFLLNTTDELARDPGQDMDMFTNGNRKARSITAFFGQKRGAETDPASQGATLGRMNTNTNRRSLDGILRPEMTPMSIIPYPVSTQLSAGIKQPGVGQTPRKAEIPRLMTPVPGPRNLRKGFGTFAENREAETAPSEDRNVVVFMSPEAEGETDVGAGAATGVGGYMRLFEGSAASGNAGGLPSSLERNIASPLPGHGYELGGLANNTVDEQRGVFGLSSSLGGMAEAEASLKKYNSMQRNLRGTKRGMHHEDVEESGRHVDEGNWTQNSAKRIKQVQHDSNEYFPISSPRMLPTPGPSLSSVGSLDPSLVVGSLFENMEEFVNLQEIEADWKRWRECTTDEWLKGADELAKDYADILNMVKDHITEKVLAYSSMVSSVEVRRAEVNHNIEMIREKGNIVRENIAKLGTK